MVMNNFIISEQISPNLNEMFSEKLMISILNLPTKMVRKHLYRRYI